MSAISGLAVTGAARISIYISMDDASASQEAFEAALQPRAFTAAWRYAWYLSRNREDAQDLLQDALALAFTAELRVEDPALRDSLLGALSASGLVHPPLLWELYPIKVPLTQLQGLGSWHAAE